VYLLVTAVCAPALTRRLVHALAARVQRRRRQPE
jgi:hypothetical protein